MVSNQRFMWRKSSSVWLPWLPDHDLSGLGKEYGLDLSREAPICQKDANGNFTTPLPDSLAAE
jgi:hypothetical protein